MSALSSPLTHPALLHAQLWRASSLGAGTSRCVASGFAALDAELPGSGWPTRGLSEILSAGPGLLEWRLLAPALRPLLLEPAALADRTRKRPAMSVRVPQRPLMLINPPHTPHLPGLQASGLPAQQLVWISAATPQQQLWATEQAIKSNAAAAVMAWLPQARPEQLRRLQSHAQASDAPVFIFRPLSAAGQSSAAPLRVLASPGPDWGLSVQILKRRGPTHAQQLHLPAMPADLAQVLSPRMLAATLHPPQPSHPPLAVEPRHALARTLAFQPAHH